MNPENIFQLCRDELTVLQHHIARYDQNGVTIKSWCLAMWSAVSAYGIEKVNARVLLLALAVIIGSALSELTYRRYQRRFIVRVDELSLLLAQGDFSTYEYGVARAAEAVQPRPEIRFAVAQPHFYLFYLFFSLLTIVCTLYLR